jgi:hypothetical protein
VLPVRQLACQHYSLPSAPRFNFHRRVREGSFQPRGCAEHPDGCDHVSRFD